MRDQSEAPKDEATSNQTDNVMHSRSTSASPNPKDLNKIVDLKQAFMLKTKVSSLRLHIGDCVGRRFWINSSRRMRCFAI